MLLLHKVHTVNSITADLPRNLRINLSSGSLSNYRQLYWTLKPLFFEVPTGESSAGFVGRQWLYREISEHLTSDLPTNRGVIVAGNPATGKTAAILQLVENRCVCWSYFPSRVLALQMSTIQLRGPRFSNECKSS